VQNNQFASLVEVWYTQQMHSQFLEDMDSAGHHVATSARELIDCTPRGYRRVWRIAHWSRTIRFEEATSKIVWLPF
jgi:hypothetical protein